MVLEPKVLVRDMLVHGIEVERFPAAPDAWHLVGAEEGIGRVMVFEVSEVVRAISPKLLLAP